MVKVAVTPTRYRVRVNFMVAHLVGSQCRGMGHFLGVVCAATRPIVRGGLPVTAVTATRFHP